MNGHGRHVPVVPLAIDDLLVPGSCSIKSRGLVEFGVEHAIGSSPTLVVDAIDDCQPCSVDMNGHGFLSQTEIDVRILCCWKIIAKVDFFFHGLGRSLGGM